MKTLPARLHPALRVRGWRGYQGTRAGTAVGGRRPARQGGAVYAPKERLKDAFETRKPWDSGVRLEPEPARNRPGVRGGISKAVKHPQATTFQDVVWTQQFWKQDANGDWYWAREHPLARLVNAHHECKTVRVGYHDEERYRYLKVCGEVEEGTTLLDEKPLLHTDLALDDAERALVADGAETEADGMGELLKRMKSYCLAEEGVRKKVDLLSAPRVADAELFNRRTHRRYVALAEKAANLDWAEGFTIDKLLETIYRWQTNKLLCCNNTAALFLIASMVDHSCVPNAEWQRDAVAETNRLVALRPMQKDEHVTIDYTADETLSDDERLDFLFREYYFRVHHA